MKLLFRNLDYDYFRWGRTTNDIPRIPRWEATKTWLLLCIIGTDCERETFTFQFPSCGFSPLDGFDERNPSTRGYIKIIYKLSSDQLYNLIFSSV